MTAACQDAHQSLLASLTQADFDWTEVETAIEANRLCTDFKYRVEHLIRALQTTEEDRLTCQECEEHMAGYIDAEAVGQTEMPLWRNMTLHLATCPYCAGVYADFQAWVDLAFDEEAVEPDVYPEPDLTFLTNQSVSPSASSARPWTLEHSGRLIVRFSSELIRRWQSLTLQSPLVPSGMRSEEQNALGQYRLEGEVEDRNVVITVSRHPDDPNQYQIVVEVEIPSRGGWPQLADTEVVLKRDDHVLVTGFTDAFGRVIFDGITSSDLERLVFEIMPDTDEVDQV